MRIKIIDKKIAESELRESDGNTGCLFAQCYENNNIKIFIMNTNRTPLFYMANLGSEVSCILLEYEKKILKKCAIQFCALKI